MILKTNKRGTLGFHGLRIGLILAILALRFWVLRLYLAGFQVLRCVTGWGLANLCAQVLGISFKTFYFEDFPSRSCSPCG